MKNLIQWILPLLLTLGLCACEEHNTVRLNTGEYFPLEEHREWRYQRWYTNSADDSLQLLFDTLNLQVHDEVIVEGKRYKEIMEADGVLNKIVRIEGSKYFARNHELYLGNFSHEYIFLDTDKAPGDSWFYIKDDGNSKTEYVILAKNATHTILGIVYKDVIEIQVNYYNQTTPGVYEPWVSAIHYYAKGVGEIYHYYPYPISLVYGNLSSFIMNDK